MSRFIEQVEAKLTGKTVATVPQLTVSIDREEMQWPERDRLVQYDIGVEWRVRTHCLPKDLEHILGNVVHQLRDDVYGEFRRRALAIQQAAYEQDFDKMHMHIRDLLREINGG